MANLLKCFLSGRDRDQSETSTDATGRGKIALSARETWTVIYDGIVDAATVLGATGLPRASYFYNGLVCVRVNPVRRSESRNVWSVGVEYATLQPPSDSGNNWNINFSKGTNGRTQTSYTDVAGEHYTNTADDRLLQQPVDTIYDEVFTVSWDTSVAPSWANDGYEGCYNTDAVTFTICGITRNCAPGTLKCVGMPLNCVRTVIGSVGGTVPINRFTYHCELSFQYRRDTWRWSAPNEGYNAYDDLGEKHQVSQNTSDPLDPDSPGKTVATYLDENGRLLPPDTTPLKLPDDVLDDDRYSAAWRFYVGTPKSIKAFGPLFTGLNDSEQPPPHSSS